jgi:hypothetical protein
MRLTDLSGIPLHPDWHDANRDRIAALEAKNAALLDEVEAARKALDGIETYRKRQLYETCPDCEDGCTHGAAYDPILLFVKAAKETP